MCPIYLMGRALAVLRKVVSRLVTHRTSCYNFWLRLCIEDECPQLNIDLLKKDIVHHKVHKHTHGPGPKVGSRINSSTVLIK